MKLMTEIRLGLWLGILSTLSIVVLNWGCAEVVSHVARPGGHSEEIQELRVPPPVIPVQQ